MANNQAINTNDFEIENGVLKKYKGQGGDVVVPNGVVNIGESAFEDCSSLTSIVLPNGLMDIRDGAFSGCSSLTRVVLPKSIRNIYNFVFSGCAAMTSLDLPDGIVCLGSYLFSGCGIKNLVLPNSITNIGAEFLGCDSLIGITIPNSVTRIDEGAFSECENLRSVTMPKRLAGFMNTKLKGFFGANYRNINFTFTK